jgi:hypothetical protein
MKNTRNMVETANPAQGGSLWCHEAQRKKEARRTNTQDKQVWQLGRRKYNQICAERNAAQAGPRFFLHRYRLLYIDFSINEYFYSQKLSIFS